jgi:arylsulfatase A-like enzyme
MKSICLFLSLIFTSVTLAQVKQPNVVVILLDDFDFDEMGYFDPMQYPTYTLHQKKLDGNKNGWGVMPTRPYTPAMDQLANKGLVFTQYRVATTICTPSRYSLLTGNFPSRAASFKSQECLNQPISINNNSNITIEDQEWNIAKGFKKLGYTTGMVGKWHLTDHRRNIGIVRKIAGQSETQTQSTILSTYQKAVNYMQDNHGFDQVRALYMGNANGLGLPKELYKLEGNMEWFADEAIQFIESQQQNPFFLYFSPNLPHGLAGKKFLEGIPNATSAGLLHTTPTNADQRQKIIETVQQQNASLNTATSTYIDQGIQRIINTLEKLNLIENTIIVLTSDHQSRGKSSVYEAARVPFIIHWPAIIKKHQELAATLSSVDLAPTLLELAGNQESIESDGISFAQGLLNNKIESHPCFIETGSRRAVVYNDLKYIAERDAEIATPKSSSNKHEELDESIGKYFPAINETDQLYHLLNDPLEQTNLFSTPEYQSQLSQLKKLLQQHCTKMNHPFGEFFTPHNN